MVVLGGRSPAADEAGDTGTHRAGGHARQVLAALLLVAVAAGAASLLITARNGPGITPDSATYLAAAMSLRAGDGLRGPDGDAFVAFPPLYPALIAPAAGGRDGAVAAARMLNALGYGVTVLLTGLLVWRLSGSRVYSMLAGAAVAVSRPVLNDALHVWSEVPFIALSMAVLLFAVEGMLRRWAPAALTGGALAGLAALARYAGLALAPLVLAAAVAGGRRGRSALLLGVGVAAAAAVPVALWIAGNLAVSGTATGERHRSAETPAEVAYQAALALSRWAVPLALGDRGRLLVVATGAVALAAGAWWAARRRGAVWREGTALIAGHCILYVAYLIAAASLTALDPIDGRLISPLASPLVALAFVALAAIAREGRHVRGRWVATAGLVTAAVWVALLTRDSLALVRSVEERGVGGYEAARWRESPLLAALRDEAPSGTIFSNDPFAVWYWTGREARLSPRRYPYRSPGTRVDDFAVLRAALAGGGPIYLVWFEGVPRDFLLSFAHLESILDFEPVLRAEDGAVYRISDFR